MEIAKSLVSLGISFAPVPGLGAAFDILDAIWQSVQQASTNRDALRNLVRCTAEILVAIDQVLVRSQAFTAHIRALLHSLESMLHEFREFAEKHGSLSLFRLLLKNGDVEGQIEAFQSRLQTLLMAFNIAALGSIDSQLVRIIDGQSAAGVPAVPPKGAAALQYVKEYDPVLVHASFSEPCTLTLNRGGPVLTCLYFPKVDLHFWGLTKPLIKDSADSFTIAQGEQTWSWALVWKEITVQAHEAARPGWPDSLTIVFANEGAARAWWAWLRAYAAGARGARAPENCGVWVRKRYDCYMQRTPTRIERQPPRSTRWITVLGGAFHSARTHATHFTYMQRGTLPCTRVYRSGDTLVLERLKREDDEAPTAARRYRLGTEAAARGWYAAWRACIMAGAGAGAGGDAGGPGRAGVLVRGRATLHVRDGTPLLESWHFPKEVLRDWGVQKPGASTTRTAGGFEVLGLAGSWAWALHGRTVSVQGTLAAQPDTRERLEMVFRGAAPAAVWFAYLAGGARGEVPRGERVNATRRGVCWMQDADASIDTRTAISDSWHAVFGRYKRIVMHDAHVEAVTARGQEHLMGRTGRTLWVERRSDADTVREEYEFEGEADARAWFDRWKAHLRR